MNEPQPEYIVIGKIMSSKGYQGHLKVAVETDFPQRYTPSSKVFIDGSQAVIESVDWHKGRAIVKIEGLDAWEEAEELTGKTIEIHNSQLFDLGKDEYYHFQLIGLKVKTTSDEVIGELTDILSMSSADVYVVKGENGEILIPATDEVIKSIEPESGFLIIEPVPGLLDLNEKKVKPKKL